MARAGRLGVRPARAARRQASGPFPQGRGPLAPIHSSTDMLLLTIRRLAPAACLAAGACYSYATTVPSSLHDGQGVRVELTETGSGAMASALGPRALSLDGRVTSRTDSSFEVAVSDITRANGVEELW